MAGAMVDQQPLRGCVAQVLPGRVGRECRRPRSRGQRECWRTVGSRTSALTPRIFGTNRGTWGFNPVWTACDMIMKSKSELEALVLAVMRNDPGCASLRQIRIETDRYGVWSIVSGDETSGFSPEVSKAARKAQIALRPKYRLAPNS